MIIDRSERIAAGDLLDRGIDTLRTIHMALNPDSKGWLDDQTLVAVWGTLDGVIRELEPVREALQNPDAEQPRRMVGGDRNG